MLFKVIFFFLLFCSFFSWYSNHSWGGDSHPRKVRIKNIVGPQGAQGAAPKVMLRGDGSLPIKFVNVTGSA